MPSALPKDVFTHTSQMHTHKGRKRASISITLRTDPVLVECL